MLESRVIIGPKNAFNKMRSAVKASDWSSQSFLVEKQKEQKNRHANFSNTAYNLEPNIKESPGGLRDIQTISWVAKWYFNVDDLHDLVKAKYLSDDEYQLLKSLQLFLWKVRFALHIVAHRRDDRLAFQYQKQVGDMLGYVDGDSMAVEQFMKDYYQTVTKVARLSDILLQLLEDKILNTQRLNSRFRISYAYIHASNDTVFSKNPAAFIEIFLLLAKHNYVRGISAGTLRQMQDNIGLIDENYHKKYSNNRLFIELLQQNQGINKALKLMNRYGILEHYIPAFGKIVGLMQYDLFHAFTVDQHTLFVIRNLRRFFVREFEREFSLCSEVTSQIKKPELLFLAGLFHDIAKGRGGDHAQLGKFDAYAFCKNHQLNQKDTNLVAGLVEKHLLMSDVAQKQDIDNPQIIKKFADKVGSLEFLQYLYLLTVADIRATKNNLWNGWKDALLKKLFNYTKHYLAGETRVLLSHKQRGEDNKQAAIQAAITQGFEREMIDEMLDNLPNEYYLRYELDDILWHLSLQCRRNTAEIVLGSKISESGVVDIFILCEDFKGLFLNLMSVVERLGLDVVDAKILTTKNKKAYNTISVLQDENLDNINIHQTIRQALSAPKIDVAKPKEQYSHQYFDHETYIDLSEDSEWHLTKLNLNTLNKIGILSNIAYVFCELDISLLSARISTMGERVENVFFIHNVSHQPLNKAQKLSLKTALKARL
jgi:[protein-PII] uridylyltransferase